MNIELHKATLADVQTLRRIFSAASEGIADYFWDKSRVADQTVDDVAEVRMREKILDPKNSCWIAVVDGKPAGGILSYQIEDRIPLEELSPMVASFVAFENEAVGTYYINCLAVFPEFQRLGIGTRLIERARQEAGKRDLSLAVSDVNEPAKATYAATGFAFQGAFPKVKEDWDGEGDDWFLMIAPAA